MQQHLRCSNGASKHPPTQINLLLSRENITSSLYLARFITATLTLPLHALADERTVAQITADRQLIRRVVLPLRRQSRSLDWRI